MIPSNLSDDEARLVSLLQSGTPGVDRVLQAAANLPSDRFENARNSLVHLKVLRVDANGFLILQG